MKMNYVWQLIKGTAESMTLGAGIAGVVITAVAAFVTVAPIISIPVIISVGVLFGAFGLYTSHRDYVRKTAKDAVKAAARQQTLETNLEAKASVQRIDNKLKTIEEKISERPLSKRPSLQRSTSFGSANLFTRESVRRVSKKQSERVFDNDKRYGEYKPQQLSW